MVRRNQLLTAVEGRLEDVTAFIAECKSQGRESLSETLGSCSKKQLDRIWERTHNLVLQQPDSVPDTSIPQTGEPDQDDQDEIPSAQIQDPDTQPSASQLPAQHHDPDSEMLSAEEGIDGLDGGVAAPPTDAGARQLWAGSLEPLVALMSALLTQKTVYIPQAARLVAKLLRDTMSSLPATEHKLRNSIAHVFEEWWKKDLPGREELIGTSFVYIIERSLDLQPKPLIVDLKRVWSLHEVLHLMDLQRLESDTVRNLLQRCFIHPHYLQHEEGLKFLGFVLSQNEEFTSSLHKLIKRNLPSVNRSLQSKYGEVYFRAWQRLEGAPLLRLEEDCVQDLMYHAIHAKHALFTPLRKILSSSFHHHKKQRGVDEMLLRLYEPILWRSLHAANHKVRENAATLFFDVFPLQSADMTNEESQALLDKQFEMFQVLLQDPYPGIRALSVLGMFRAMRTYWEMFPQDKLRAFILQLLRLLSTDTEAAEVREGVIRGLQVLLDNVLSHVFLAPLIGQTRNSFHDVSEKVRTAMCELLLKIKCLRSIKYWHVVPIEHLLARLVVDSDPVNKRIIKLLFTSFMPLEASTTVQVERCMVLVESNPAAARQFFRYARHNMSVDDTVAYMLALCKAIIVDMRHRAGPGSADDSQAEAQDNDNDKEDQEEKEDPGGDAMSPVVVRGLCEAICLLWRGINEELKKESNAAMKKSLQKSFSYALKEMMKVYSDPQIVSVVVQIAGFLPANYVPTMSRTWMAKLRAMTSETPVEDYSVILESLCLSNRGPEILELAVEWLQTPLEPAPTPDPAGPQKKKKKRVGFVEQRSPQPGLALDFLRYVFQHTLTREKLLKDHRDACEGLRNVLQKSMGAIERYVSGQSPGVGEDIEKLLTSIFALHCELELLLHSTSGDEPEEDGEVMLGVLGWADKHVLPVLEVKCCLSDDPGHKGAVKRHELAYTILEGLLGVFNNMLLVGVGDGAMCTKVVDFCSTAAAVDSKLRLLPAILQNLIQVTEFVNYLSDEEGRDGDTPDDHVTHAIPTALTRVFLSIASFVKNNQPQAPKGNRVVPVLIPEDARSPLDFVSTREVRRRAGIPDKNDYLFPIVGRTEGRQSHARAYSSLKKTCGECSLVAPTRINSVSMRKYTATLTQTLSGVKGHLTELIRGIFKRVSLDATIKHDVLGTILASILAEMKHSSQEMNLEEEPTTEELPILSHWLVGIIQQQTHVLRYFVLELSEFCESGVVADVHNCHGVVHLVCALARGGKLKRELSDLCGLADRQTATVLQELSETDRENNTETINWIQGKFEKCKGLLGIQVED